METEIPELQFCDIGDASLPYLHFPGDGIPMVFVHATGFLPWLWQPIIQEFVPDASVWAPFICNYRECDPEKGGLSWDTIARDLAEFCRLRQIHEPLVIGHSMGASVITFAAALYGLAPRGMVLIEPIFLPERFYSLEMKLQEHPLAAKVIKRTNQWENEKEALDYLKSKALFDGWDQRILHLYIKYGMQKQDDGNLKLTCSPQSEAALYMGGRKNNPWPLIPRITCPVLLVEGERSDNKKIIDLKKAASTFPKGEYECVEAAGHLIPMQKPEEIVKIIKKFIANNFQ